MGLAIPPDGKPARELADLYRKDGRTIFGRPRGFMRALWGPKYSNGPLKEVVTKSFGSAKVSEAIVNTLVVCYDIHRRNACVF